MTLDDLLSVCDLLDDAAAPYWIGGGWGVDVLAGEQTRSHRDVDLALDAASLPVALAVLSAAGYVTETDWLPVRVELVAPGGRWVDVHPVVLDAEGNGVQAGLDGAEFVYPAADLVSGVLGGRRLPCISAGLQRTFRTGYDLRAVDVADLHVLDNVQARAASSCLRGRTWPC